MADLSAFMDFMEDEDGFESPLMPSREHPEGKSYHVPSPDGETGLQLSALADLTMKQKRGLELQPVDIARLRLNDNDEREFIGKVLSPELVAQLAADGCKWEHIKRLSLYAFTFFGVSREAADNAAKAGLFSGKALPQNRAQRRSTGAKSAKSPASAGSKKPRKAPSA